MNLVVAFLIMVAAATYARSADSNVIATVPITFQHGQVMVAAQVNGSGPYSFMLDTGFSMTMLRPELPEQLKLRRVGEITVEGIAGDERAPTYEGAQFALGSVRYEPRRVGAMSATRRKRDGVIGSGLFRQYVLRLDPDAKTLAIINPTNFVYHGSGEIIPLRFRRSTTPIVDATINVTNGSAIRGAFEVDTGCDGALCIESDFARSNKLVDLESTRSATRYGVGGGASTRSGSVPELQLGTLKIARPDAEFFVEGSPAGRGLAGHVGMGVFRQFRVYFDYPRQRMILEPLARK